MEEYIQSFVEGLFSTYLHKMESQSLVLDFSSSFRKSKVKTKKPKKEKSAEPAQAGLTPLAEILNVDPDWDFDPLTSGIRPRDAEGDLPVTYEIPDDLKISEEEMSARRYLDLKRWHCLSRPQYRKSCGISSLVSCWNYLFSWLGHGTLAPVSQEKALTILGIAPPYSEVMFGPFTGNSTLIQWFKALCLHFEVQGSAQIFWKMHGKSRTVGVDGDQAFENLAQGLKSATQAFVYHCYNHYFCPIGFEVSPIVPTDAYKPLAQISPSEVDRYVIIGEPSKSYASLQVKKWDDIVKDISSQNPQYFNIRKPELGVQERTGQEFRSGKKLGGNIHCLLVFQSSPK